MKNGDMTEKKTKGRKRHIVTDTTDDSGTVTVQSTETSPGVMTYSCSVCGHIIRTETIPAMGSNYYPTYPVISSPNVFTESMTVKAE